MNADGPGTRGGHTTVTKGGLIRVVVYLNPDERMAMKTAALEQECSASDIVREALREYLEMDEDELPEDEL